MSEEPDSTTSMDTDPDTPYDWRMSAYCIGLDWSVFFPKRGESVLPARAICDHCVVAVECLEDALARKESAGVRAGLSTKDRRNIIRARKRQAEKRRGGTI